MKKKLFILSLLAIVTASILIFGTSCSKDSNTLPEPMVENVQADGPGGGEDEEEMHHPNLIIYTVNSANNPASMDYCMYNTNTSAQFDCQSSTHSPNVDAEFELGFGSTPANGYEFGVYYYIIPAGSYPKQILRYKIETASCVSPWTATSRFYYNISTKQFSLSSLACEATYNIINASDPIL